MKQLPVLKPGVPVILADGLFPENPVTRLYIDKASAIICCDGSTTKLLDYGLTPNHIVGDMDTLSKELQQQFQSIIVQTSEQETNDLTKAVNHAIKLGYRQAVILGATGNREDHTLGNIGLLSEHGQKLQLQMVSDFGIFTPVYTSTRFSAQQGQQVSIFSIRNNTPITSTGLKYPLQKLALNNWWMGTLNEAVSDSFSLEFSNGAVVVFSAFLS